VTKQKERDGDVVAEMSQEVDSRGDVLYIEMNYVIFKDERVGGRARVTSDDERVQRGGWRDISSYIDRMAEWY